MVVEAEVRENVIAVLRNELSLSDFEDWLVQHSWNMHQDSAPSAQELVSAIELALFEHSSGHLAEAELRAELLSLASHVSVSIAIGAQRIQEIQPARSPASAANSYQLDVRLPVPLPA